MPRVGLLKPIHRLCELHFEERYILKTYTHVINGQTVETPRGRWDLQNDAIPTLFPNIPKYLSSKAPASRVRLQRMLNTNHSKKKLKCIERVATSNVDVDYDVDENFDKSGVIAGECVSTFGICTQSADAAKIECQKCCDRFIFQNERYQLRRRLTRQSAKINNLHVQVRKLRAENRTLKRRLTKVAVYDVLPAKQKLILEQSVANVSAKSKYGNRFSPEWMIDALLIRCKSTSTYKLLRDNSYLPLPSISTLNLSIKAMRPEFGFDKALCAGLKEKLSSFPMFERRGLIMFDEIQISKNMDFRVDTAKVVGMVDFGNLTTEQHTEHEGDHALVFLFQPHLGGWVQTIGSFCSAGTTPTAILAKLILEAIILLENCGAFVDGLVSDGASTNRAALASFGFCGELGKVQNKMVNPCDDQRSIYFFCDTPHLLKTMRNNLLKARELMVLSSC